MKALLLILIFSSFILSAQNKKKKNIKTIGRHTAFSFDIYYGKSVFTKKFYNQTAAFNKINFTIPNSQIGIGYTNYYIAIGRRMTLAHQMGINYYIPGELTVNDSVKSNISGYSYSFGLGYGFFRKLKSFKLNAYLGFNTGRTILTKKDNLNLKNPFFAPKILIQPKLCIKRFCFSLLFNYCYDISNKNWKKMRGSTTLYNIDKFDQSNYVFLISIGYCPF